jgi:GT2 family glycosyltransferase
MSELESDPRCPVRWNMNNPSVIRVVLVNYKDYASKYLEVCLESLRKQDFAGKVVIDIIDNEASAQTEEYIRASAPEAHYLPFSENLGFARACNVGIGRAIESGDKYVFLLNMDAFLSPSTLRLLVDYMERNDSVGAVQPLILQWPDTAKIDTAGNVVHVLGFGLCDRFGQHASSIGLLPFPVGYCSGAAVLYRVKALMEVGGFDEDMWMYCEDQDLGIRLRLLEWENVCVPSAIAYHAHEMTRSERKFALIECNRYLFMLKNYRWATLALLVPLLAGFDLSMLIVAVVTPQLRFKLEAVGRLFTNGRLRRCLANRKQLRKRVRVKDKDILRYVRGTLEYGGFSKWITIPLSVVCSFYLRALRFLVQW